jgi:uncharacterized repeat protein (TIGR01451 family)
LAVCTVVAPSAHAADSLLSQGKPTTASSVEGPGTPASNATDGNTGTRWASAFSDPQWLAVDLGATAAVDKVVLNWENAYATAFQIQTSNDNSTWTPIYSTTTGTGGIQTLTVSGSGRYIRMYGTTRATQFGYSLWEFQVYGTIATGSCDTTNVALNKPTTASSVENPGTPASNATDGNLATRWSSASSDPQWLAVDLGSTQSICEVVLYWEAAFATAFQIQTSNDGTTWTPIFSTTTGPGGVQPLFVSGSGRYIRMYGTARATQFGYSLFEFQVFNGPPVPPTPMIDLVETVTSPAPPGPAHAVGDVISYSFHVTDTGATPLTNVGVADAQTAPAGALTSGPTCQSTTLAAGASTDCVATYTVTQADVDNGKVDDTAVSHGTPPVGAPVDSPPRLGHVTITQNPSIHLDKEVTPNVAQKAGDTVQYSFVVTNTGNITLTAIQVVDTFVVPAGPELVVTCPRTPVAPTMRLACSTGRYTITRADVNHGRVDNTAVATGQLPSGSRVTSNRPSAEVTIASVPAGPVPGAMPKTGSAALTFGGYALLATASGALLLAIARRRPAPQRRRRSVPVVTGVGRFQQDVQVPGGLDRTQPSQPRHGAGHRDQ